MSITKGKIVLLNGASSAGKSSIAKQLQNILDAPYLHLGIDAFAGMMPARYFAIDPEEGDPSHQGVVWLTMMDGTDKFYQVEFGTFADHIFQGMHNTILGLASIGHNLIVDDVILRQTRLKKYIEILKDFEVWFVQVFCPLPVLEERERVRRDRLVGQARGQYHLVHKPGIYDITLDTSVLNPEECAEQIKIRLLSGDMPTAFDRLSVTMLT